MPTDSKAPERPRQVTLSGWLIIVGSVLVVLSAYERMSGLHSLETQEAISDFLSKPPGDELGLSREGAQSLLRLLAMVAGAAAAAAAILGWQVLSRSRSARVALSVLTVPLFVGGMAVFGFLAALVVVAIVMLWVQPAKDWFNGISPVARVAPAPPRRAPVAPVASAEPAWPPSAPQQAAPQPPAPQPAAPRPASVTAGAIVTWVTCGLALLLMGITVLVLLAAPDVVFDEVRKQDPSFGQDGLTESEVRQAAFVGCGIAGLWCIAAIGFAVAAFNGYRWGWRALLISTITAGVASSLLMLGSVVMLVPLVAAAVTLGMLLRPESKAWCRRTSGGRGSVSP